MLHKMRAAFGGDARGSGDDRADPASWALALFVFFGAAQIVAGAVYFFAYNWRDLPDMAKILLPQAAMAIGYLAFALAPARSAIGASGAVLATVMIGVAMGVVGQVYQLGADPWQLFAVWAAFALPLSIVARNDAHFTVFFLIATTAYFLWAEEHLRPRLDWAQAVPSIYAGAALLILFAREAAGGAPRWHRWLLAAFALGTSGAAAIGEIDDARLFSDGCVGTLALAAVAAAIVAFYTLLKPDRPAQALAFFTLAAWAGVFGVRTIFRMELNSAGEFSLGFILAALWIVAVTAALAFVLRGRGK